MSTLSVDTIQGKTTAGNVAFPAGVVIQIVDFTASTQVVNNTTSYVSSGLGGSITPKFSSSKMYVVGFVQTLIEGHHDHGIGLKLVRTLDGSDTDVYTPATKYERYFFDGTANTTNHSTQERLCMFATDTPNTLLQCTYTFHFASMRTDNSNSVRTQSNNNKSMGYIMEIAQ